MGTAVANGGGGSSGSSSDFMARRRENWSLNATSAEKKRDDERFNELWLQLQLSLASLAKLLVLLLLLLLLLFPHANVKSTKVLL